MTRQKAKRERLEQSGAKGDISDKRPKSKKLASRRKEEKKLKLVLQ